MVWIKNITIGKKVTIFNYLMCIDITSVRCCYNSIQCRSTMKTFSVEEEREKQNQ